MPTELSETPQSPRTLADKAMFDPNAAFKKMRPQDLRSAVQKEPESEAPEAEAVADVQSPPKGSGPSRPSGPSDLGCKGLSH